MRLATEITVAAPLERTWPALLELGPVSLELGGRWEVSAMLDDADEDEHAAGFHVVAHERGGSGMAAATIRARARARGDDHGADTRIAFETDLRLTGAAGRPDQAAAQAAADELLGRVAAHLERAASPTPVVEAAPEVGPPEPVPEVVPEEPRSKPPPLKGSDPLHHRKGSDPSPGRAASEPLALTDPVIASGQVAERALLVTAGVALGLAVGRLVWRRR